MIATRSRFAAAALWLAFGAACSKPGKPDEPIDPQVSSGAIGAEVLKVAQPIFDGRRFVAVRALGPDECKVLAESIRSLGRLIPLAARSATHADKVLTEVALDEVFRSLFLIQDAKGCDALVAEAWQRLRPSDGLSWTPPLDRADVEARARAREACPSGIAAKDNPRPCQLSDADRVKMRHEIQGFVREAAKSGRTLVLSPKSVDLGAIEIYAQRIDDAKLIDLHADLFIDAERHSTAQDGGTP